MGLCEWRVYNSVLKGIFVVAGGEIFFFFFLLLRSEERLPLPQMSRHSIGEFSTGSESMSI